MVPFHARLRRAPPLAWAGIAAALLLAAPVEARDVALEKAQLETLVTGDRRVAAVAYRLAAAGAPLCRDTAPLTGLLLHDALQYEPAMRDTAGTLFGFGDGPSILAVAPGSPAAKAGALPNDAILAINGADISYTRASARARAKASYARMAQVLDRLDAALAAGGALRLDVARGAERLTLAIAPVTGCASRVQLVPDSAREAGADGRMISVTTAMADYTVSDDELAVVIAHEMAHNALRHRAMLDEKGVPRGFLSHFGNNAAAIRKTEEEADHLSIYLMARAGYDITAAQRFWQRFGRATDLGPFSDPTHPRWREREQALGAAIAEVELKKAGGELVPERDDPWGY